ncbi:uncharacterized protein FA14DRAFT_154418 [Meira miltonrushii]|uniref:Uncharacterized protein n=1 Tax=Meira miltonrushii TaxID=1280837 RepID=A0A316VBG6_9BASI|nr:uncharacterized protein FA14DRAFT_154418 [Meira miltonrushii]PWN34989.1 hypothetical protein FA14DRAFT_154418 [Meira miltonrushii]
MFFSSNTQQPPAPAEVTPKPRSRTKTVAALFLSVWALVTGILVFIQLTKGGIYSLLALLHLRSNEALPTLTQRLTGTLNYSVGSFETLAIGLGSMYIIIAAVPYIKRVCT